MKSLLVGLLFFLLLIPSASAQEELEIDPPLSVTPTIPTEVNYTLPFPGILPDNPLYSLKAARDRVVSFFISDQLKKADFDLLQADKRINAGLFLLGKEKQNVPLAISTISKGQNYFEEAVHSYHNALKNKDKTEIGDLPDRLTRASLKYTELLKKQEKSLPDEKKKEFQMIITRSETLTKMITPVKK